jgi:hypothetical protein
LGVKTPYAVRVEQPVPFSYVVRQSLDKGSALTILENSSRVQIGVDEAEMLLRALEMADCE